MGLATHRYLMQHHLQDYAQTMALAKLIAGCPVDPAHTCDICRREKSHQVRRLFVDLQPVVMESRWPADLNAYRYRCRVNEAHRRFLDMWRPGSRATNPSADWFSRRLRVSPRRVMGWIQTERKRKHLHAGQLPGR
jgi:hypothetical protein